MIELLVVIAIIGILASVVLASLNKARKQGRDARRVSDMKQVQLALELYFDVARRYPASATIWGSGGDLQVAGVMSATPKDPLDEGVAGAILCRKGNYCYASRSDAGYIGMSYHMGTMMELAETPALAVKRGCSSSVIGSCMPVATYSSPFDATVATNPLIYDVVP